MMFSEIVTKNPLYITMFLVVNAASEDKYMKGVVIGAIFR
jgi:hypothetical protein